MKTTEQQLQREADTGERYPGPTDWKISTEEKRWTDEDMYQALIAGMAMAIAPKKNLMPPQQWLEQYKAKKQ